MIERFVDQQQLVPRSYLKADLQSSALHMQIHEHQLRVDVHRTETSVSIGEIVPKERGVGVLDFTDRRFPLRDLVRALIIERAEERRREVENDHPQTRDDRVGGERAFRQSSRVRHSLVEFRSTDPFPGGLLRGDLGQAMRTDLTDSPDGTLPAMVRESTVD